MRRRLRGFAACARRAPNRQIVVWLPEPVTA
jgi:hypothetical protein